MIGPTNVLTGKKIKLYLLLLRTLSLYNKI